MLNKYVTMSVNATKPLLDRLPEDPIYAADFTDNSITTA